MKIVEIYATIENMSNNLKRKLEKKKRKQESKKAEKLLSNKIKGIILPDECTTCKTSFDKKSRDMAMSWMVIANEDRKHLVCPKCWDKIKSLNTSQS